jgi:hypothetical protein
MKFKIKGKEVYMDGYLKSNLETVKEFIDNDFDGVGIIDGMEGSGKSELGKQCCLHHDKNFSEKDVIYTVDQFYTWLDNAKPGSACLWDEFVLAGLSKDALGKVQKSLIKKFTLIRSKKLLIILVIPYFFMLQRYFAFSRTRFLIHTYTDGLQRGYFRFYNYKQKKWLYLYGYKTWDYNEKVRPSFHGRFVKWSDKFLDEDAIKLKKEEANKSIDEDEKANKWEVRTKNLVKGLLADKVVTQKDIADYIGEIDRSTLSSWIK